jgi:hypothetical protein
VENWTKVATSRSSEGVENPQRVVGRRRRKMRRREGEDDGRGEGDEGEDEEDDSFE